VKELAKNTYLPIVHSQCESKNIRTAPVAIDAPICLAVITPTRLLVRLNSILGNSAK